MKNKKVAVIGGSRGLGKWIAKFLKKEGFKVTITSRDHEYGRKVPKKMGVKYCENNIDAAKSSDIVIVSVPIASTVKVIKEIAPHLRKGSLLLDVTSIKEKPAKAMEKYVPNYVEVLPTHPMFGPRITSLDGQVVILTPIRKSKCLNKVINFLKEKKARVIVTTPKKHDKMMSVIQVLTHFAYICIASTIEKLKINIKKSRKFASPIYNLMVDTIARIVAQNPHLTFSIQHENKEGEKVRKLFIDIAKKMNNIIENNEKEEFIEEVRKAAKNLGDIESALGRSDKAIAALNEEIKKLKKSVGKEVGLKHIYSGKVHVGILKEVSPDFVVLKSRKMTLKLKTSNIRILNKKELQKWKIKKFGTKKFDISAIFPEKCDPNVIAKVVENEEGVISAKIIDVYKGEQIPQGMVSITIRFEVLDKKYYQNVKKLLEGLGAKIR